MTRSRLITMVALVALLGGRAAMGQTSTQDHQNHQSQPDSATAEPNHGSGEQHAMHMRMMAQMQANGAKLDSLVETMKAATGDAKVAAIADLLTTLVQQHKAMHQMMMEHQMPMMQGHMMKMEHKK